ncbi:Uncharacterised protein [Mycobacteroides abscessus subsp. massiliense]|nr:Uncharacterised protein [Mycobacteroides abscessus subsp. massiliense]
MPKIEHISYQAVDNRVDADKIVVMLDCQCSDPR